jgi:hypothetical protein
MAVATRRRHRHELSGFTNPHRDVMNDTMDARARDNRFRRNATRISLRAELVDHRGRRLIKLIPPPMREEMN